MSDVTLQKVYDEAKLFVADTEHGLEGLIVAIREHRTDEAKTAEQKPAETENPPEPEPAA